MKTTADEPSDNTIKGLTPFTLIFDNCEYEKYESIEKTGYSVYKVEFTIVNELLEPLVFKVELKGRIGPDENDYKIFNLGKTEVPSAIPGVGPGITHETKRVLIKSGTLIGEDEERYFASHDATLKISNDNYELQAEKFIKYWKKEGDYQPTKIHLELTLPGRQWIDHYEEFPDLIDPSSGEYLKFPIFKEIYTETIFPVLFSSHRFGWLGEFISLSIDFGIAFCAFMGEFIEVTADIILLGIEVAGIITSITGLFSQISSGIPLTEEEILSLFSLFAALCATLGELLKDIKNLPISPDSPNYYLREEVANTGDALVSFLSKHPWQDDIIIRGEINNCKQDEIVTLDCRDIKGKIIPGGEGQRIIDPVSVSSIRKKGDGIIFRNCQVMINGDKHGDILKTPAALSYVAPGGDLKCIVGFPKKGRSINLPSFNNILQRFFNKPLLTKLFQNFDLLQITPSYNI